jgi:trimeric autotransporter adhesin
MATISGGSGSDFIHLSGDGLVAPGLFTDLAQATDLDDLIEAGEGDDIAYGGDGADEMRGGLGNDSLYGGAGNDLLDGLDGTDLLEGGAGDDAYLVNEAGDTIVEAVDGGIDTVTSSMASYTLGDNVENLTLATGASIGIGNTLNNAITDNGGNHNLFGREGNDSLYGGAGNDGLHGESGDNLLAGGAGNDTFYIESATDAVVEVDGEGNDTILSNVSLTMADFVENLTLAAGATNGSGTGNAQANVIAGNFGNNQLDGAGGDDSLYGGGGQDTLIGGLGADVLRGGSGNDLYVADLGDDLSEAGGSGNDTVRALVDHVLGLDFEVLDLSFGTALAGTGNGLDNVILGNSGANVLQGMAGNDQITGDLGNDSLSGGEGEDVLNGNAGLDTLEGGAGADSLNGGAGHDVYIVEDALDTITEAAGGGVDTVLSSVDLTLAFEVEKLTLTGSAISGTGNSKANTILGNGLGNVLTGAGGADILTGLVGDDTLDGGDGADKLDGGAGADSLTGGAGNDTYTVNLAGDVVVELAAGGFDLVRSFITYTLGLNVENLTLLGSNPLSGTGNAQNNKLTGNSGANALQGLAGADTLLGGGGADDFVYLSKTVGFDTIGDFNELDGGAEEGDQIVFAAALLTGSFAYVGSAAFSALGNSEARVQGNQVLFDNDGNGSVDITITLTGLVSDSQLSAGDFAFI